MIDRYTQDALACYARLRKIDTAQARAELESLGALVARVKLHAADEPGDSEVRAQPDRLLDAIGGPGPLCEP